MEVSSARIWQQVPKDTQHHTPNNPQSGQRCRGGWRGPPLQASALDSPRHPGVTSIHQQENPAKRRPGLPPLVLLPLTCLPICDISFLPLPKRQPSSVQYKTT